MSRKNIYTKTKEDFKIISPQIFSGRKYQPCWHKLKKTINTEKKHKILPYNDQLCLQNNSRKKSCKKIRSLCKCELSLTRNEGNLSKQQGCKKMLTNCCIFKTQLEALSNQLKKLRLKNALLEKKNEQLSQQNKFLNDYFQVLEPKYSATNKKAFLQCQGPQNLNHRNFQLIPKQQTKVYSHGSNGIDLGRLRNLQKAEFLQLSLGRENKQKREDFQNQTMKQRNYRPSEYDFSITGEKEYNFSVAGEKEYDTFHTYRSKMSQN